MLLGKYKYSIDSKNRICVPHKFRQDLGGICVLSEDLEYQCLNLYSIEQWKIYCAKIEQLPLIDMEEIRFLIYSNADEQEIDSQGRILLNQKLCEDVGLLNEKEAMIAGIFTHIQIWSVSEWDKYNSTISTPEKRKAVKDGLRKIGF